MRPLLPPELLFLREHWRSYRRDLPKRLGGESDEAFISPSLLWHSDDRDMWNAYAGAMQVILTPDAYETFRVLFRLQNARRQRVLEDRGNLPPSPKRLLPFLSDAQLNWFVSLANERLHRLLHPRFVPNFIHRLLWELGLFVYNGPPDALSYEEVVLLTMSGTLWGQVCGNRRGIREKHEMHPRPRRVRHPMFRKMPRDPLRRVWNYFQGGRAFLWISSVVYWRYWREFRKGNTRLGTVVFQPVVMDAPLSQAAL